ncbi:prolyl oligopeptidase family serine peptidase [Anaerocolumna jejuensis]|uniref:prolyl oligopeptidase family serine peptidase n=1 Tax=Anaerocolumna jejuensis TaxID=259063 RepID=UPI003F7BD7A8
MSNIVNLRNEITEAIGIIAPNTIPHVEYRLLDSTKADGYTRQLVEYDSYGDKVIAFLLLPEILDKNPAILINHQHNREHHLGKSEVCGLAGNPLQAFGPELVKKGFVVLAPDSICFEERRQDSHIEGFDFWQHFNEMCYRIIKGDYLMKKVLDDAMNGITLLSNLTYVDNKKISTLGHSYGGNTVLFLSAEDDKYSKDASYIVGRASSTYLEYDALQNLHHKRYPGGHGLAEERFDFIIEWLESNAKH